MKEEKNFEPLKKAFIQNNWHWAESEELFKNINVKNKEHMWLYNYGDAVFVERNHPVLMKCRGLVVSANGVVFNYPFDRFFNEFNNTFLPLQGMGVTLE
ncbi:MAG: hypothetical protein AABX82_07315, partial [Nanoarchaeota archaeon]